MNHIESTRMSGQVLNRGSEERIEREREFHDAAYSDARRKRVSHFYRVTSGSRDRFRRLCVELSSGSASVLEYGCGEGSMAAELACEAAHVTGIDISPVAIAHAEEHARSAGVTAKTTFATMDAENLAFGEATFDLVCGCAILHHLDLSASYSEIARVLRPGGRAVFLEPLGHNPLINWYRNRTPELRTPDEAPLRVHHIDLARRWFRSVEVEYFELLPLAAIPFSNVRGFRTAVRGLARADEWLFRLAPSIKKHAWFAILVLGDPHKVGTQAA